MFLLVSASLWVPARLSDHSMTQLVEQATWLVGLAVPLVPCASPSAGASVSRSW